MGISLTLASRYLAGRKLRTVLTTLAIVFGVTVIFGMNILLPAFVQSFQANILAAAGQVDATITLKTSDAFDHRLADRVTEAEGVRAVSALLNRTVNVPADYYDSDPATPDLIRAVSLVGIEPERAGAMHAYLLKSGRFLQDGERGTAVITRSLADALAIDVGGKLRLPTAEGETALTIVGLLPARAVPGNEEVFVSLEQAQAMLAMAGKVNMIEVNFDTLDDARRAAIQAEVLAALGDAFQAGSLASGSELLTNLSVAQAMFNVLGVLSLLMGGFIIFNTFRTIIAERRRDIGMLRALGATRPTILRLILTEGLLQGIVGTAAGLALGYGLGAGMSSVLGPMMMQFLNVRLGGPVVSPALIVGSAVMGIGVTVLAGLLPAWSASRATPLEALRPALGGVTLRRAVGLGFWIGTAMIAAAIAALLSQDIGLLGLGGMLFVLGLILASPSLVVPVANLFGTVLSVVVARGGTAQLAESNLSRQPTRAAVTASTTLIAMAILVMAASMITSVSLGFEHVLRRSLGSDYLFLPPAVAAWGTNVGSGQSLAETLRSVEGVALVSTLRYAPARAGDLAISMIGIDPATYPEVSGLTFTSGDESAAYAALSQDRQIIVNGLLASTAGAALGQSIEVMTPAGGQPYRVVGIAGDYLNAKIPTGYISQADLEADFQRNEDVVLQVNLAPGADRATAEAGLREAIRSYPQFRLISGDEYIEENLKLFDAAFLGMVALGLFLSVPSLIAMVNTLAIGVIERRREIGVLRAVGATRAQVRAVVVAEAVILAAIGTALGVFSGVYLGYLGVAAMRAAGYPMDYVFPASGVWLALGVGLILGVLAALIPARQAARLQIVEALRHE